MFSLCLITTRLKRPLWLHPESRDLKLMALALLSLKGHTPVSYVERKLPLLKSSTSQSIIELNIQNVKQRTRKIRGHNKLYSSRKSCQWKKMYSREQKRRQSKNRPDLVKSIFKLYWELQLTPPSEHMWPSCLRRGRTRWKAKYNCKIIQSTRAVWLFYDFPRV